MNPVVLPNRHSCDRNPLVRQCWATPGHRVVQTGAGLPTRKNSRLHPFEIKSRTGGAPFGCVVGCVAPHPCAEPLHLLVGWGNGEEARGAWYVHVYKVTSASDDPVFSVEIPTPDWTCLSKNAIRCPGDPELDLLSNRAPYGDQHCHVGMEFEGLGI